MSPPTGEPTMWGIPLSQLPEPPPPEKPSQTILSLHEKAVNRPESLTDADRRRILDRLPAEEENQTCQNICGLSWDELVHKAVSQPDDLTDDEAHLVAYGVNYPPIHKDIFPSDDYSFNAWRLHQTEDEQQRRYKAEGNAQIDVERTAAKNVYQQASLASKASSSVTRRLTGDDRRNIRYIRAIPWVQEAQLLLRWGFVLFRTSFGDDDTWKRFKAQLSDAIEISLHAVPFSARIRSTWMLQYIEDEALTDATLPQLQDRFRNMCRLFCENAVEEQGALSIQQGLRRDAFLYADADAIASVISCTLPGRGYVRAADPNFDATNRPSGDNSQGFNGVVDVLITAILTVFYARLDPGAPSPENPRDECLKQNWEVVWKKSRTYYDQQYPPPLQLNK